MLTQFPIKLKLVIAGNHDLAYDKNWRDCESGEDKDTVDKEALEEHYEAIGMMEGGFSEGGWCNPSGGGYSQVNTQQRH